ncbi:hypothetical protein ABZ468_07720 [Streptomyces sp. NPDC005708]|uniref:hypothetical protein n=1 Tax=Streptomyces sp. NPDC005708 TaxID=3154564 RepID=UPI00340CCCB6
MPGTYRTGVSSASGSQIAASGRSLRGLQTWHAAILRAVYDHPAGIAIMKAAADQAERTQGGRQRRA